MSVINLDDLNHDQLYKIFEKICENLIMEDEANSKFSAQLLKNYCTEMIRSKAQF